MAFTVIPSTAVDADSPLDVTLFGYIKDNDDYLKARAATGTGHTHNQAGTDEGGPITPADGSVTQVKLYSLTAGSKTIASAPTERSSAAAGLTKLKEIYVGQPGTYAVYFEAHDAGGLWSSARIYKNGSPVGIDRDPPISYTGYSEDLTFVGSDLVQIYVGNAPEGNTTYVQNFKLSVASPITPYVITD